MSRIIIKPIPRKKFDARVNRNMVKGSLPNHYPNTRVGLLENRVKTLEDNPPPTITLDDTVTEGSPNGVKSSGIWAALLALLQSFQNLLGLHVNADNNAHPATAITVDETPVADFTPAVKGNNLQQVTNKVAGAQLKTLVDYTLTSPQHTIEFTEDDSGKPLTIYKSIIILMDIIGFQDEIGGAVNARMAISFNDIVTGYDWGTFTNYAFIHVNGAATTAQKGMVLLQINSNGFIGFSVSNGYSYGLINRQVVEPIVKVSFSTFNPARLASIGSRIVILGQ